MRRRPMRCFWLLKALLIWPISVALALPSPAFALRAGLEGRERAIAAGLEEPEPQPAPQESDMGSGSDVLRQWVRPARQRVIQRDLAPRLPAKGVILEIGAGRRGELRALVGEALSPEATWIESDMRSDSLRPPRAFQTEKRVATLPDLPEIPDGSVDAVLSLSVLDSISPRDLPASFRAMARVLRPGGTMIHVLDAGPTFNAEAPMALEEDLIPFTYTVDQWGEMPSKRMAYLDRAALAAVMPKLRSYEMPLDVERKLQAVLTKPSALWHSSNALDFRNVAQQMGLLAGDVGLVGLVRSRLTNAVHNTGLTIDFCGEVPEEEAIVPRSALKDFPEPLKLVRGRYGVVKAFGHDPFGTLPDDKVRVRFSPLLLVAHKSEGTRPGISGTNPAAGLEEPVQQLIVVGAAGDGAALQLVSEVARTMYPALGVVPIVVLDNHGFRIGPRVLSGLPLAVQAAGWPRSVAVILDEDKLSFEAPGVRVAWEVLRGIFQANGIATTSGAPGGGINQATVQQLLAVVQESPKLTATQTGWDRVPKHPNAQETVVAYLERLFVTFWEEARTEQVNPVAIRLTDGQDQLGGVSFTPAAFGRDQALGVAEWYARIIARRGIDVRREPAAQWIQGTTIITLGGHPTLVVGILGAAGMEETPAVFMAPNAATYRGPVRVVMKVGGTTTAAQAAIAEGFVGARSVGPTLKDEPDEGRVIKGFVDVIVPVIEQYGPNNIEGVELAAPGWFDRQMIQVVRQENIVGLHRIGFSFEQAIGDELALHYAGRRDARLGPIRVRVVHDGTATGMLEVGPLGTFPGAKRLLVVDVGTGIATRMMIDGRPFLGDARIQYFHNEGPNLLMFTGHPDHPNYDYVAMRTRGLSPAMVGPTLPNGRPNLWLGVETLEQRTSGPGVARYAAQLAREPGRHDTDFASWVADLTRRAGPGGLDALTAAQVGEAARAGNPLARRAIRERMRELGIGFAVFVVESHRLFEEFGWPDHSVFGGGVSHADGELFLEAIRGGFADRLARYITEVSPADLADRLALSKYVAVDETARQMAALFPTAEEMKVYHERLQAAGLEASALDSQL